MWEKLVRVAINEFDEIVSIFIPCQITSLKAFYELEQKNYLITHESPVDGNMWHVKLSLYTDEDGTTFLCSDRNGHRWDS